jgi:hypothetical protein
MADAGVQKECLQETKRTRAEQALLRRKLLQDMGQGLRNTLQAKTSPSGQKMGRTTRPNHLGKKYVLGPWSSRNDDEHGRTHEGRDNAKHQRLGA